MNRQARCRRRGRTTEQELLPGEVRHLEPTITDIWPAGPVWVVLDVVARVAPPGIAALTAERPSPNASIRLSGKLMGKA
ncbi:MAG: hypothetical protein KIT69_00950 [Propionibacteriaceae bacterium]|nr:hypothetical protein [Propionibacteriaceae bacterium]